MSVKPKVLSYAQLSAKKYKFLPNVPEEIRKTFGWLTMNFTMMIWGKSGQGKTNLLIRLIKILIHHGKILYISAEEGHEVSMQLTVEKHLSDTLKDNPGKIAFADHSMTYEETIKRLKKKRSEQFVIIDSFQYWEINYKQYKALKEMFPNKTFIFISHKKGSEPWGDAAKATLFDMTIKVHVDRYIAFIISRLNGGENFLIWEEGAKRKWGEEFYKHFPKPKK